jgi:hypothetical protein
MARIRTIKPELPSDPSLAKCSRDARLTFTYLITQSDDYGFVPAAPRQIVGMLFPHDDDLTPQDVGRWINELVGVGLCAWVWTTDGLPLVQLMGWESHQRIDNRRKAVLSARLSENRTEPPAYANCDICHAEVRGVLAANRGESRLEPPTSDLRPVPPTSDLLSQIPDSPEVPPAELTNNETPLSPKDAKAKKAGGGWPAAVAAAWTREVGVITEGLVGRDLVGFVRLYPNPKAAEEAAVLAVTNYVATCRRRDEPPVWRQFATGIQGHIPPSMKPPKQADAQEAA